MSIEARFTLTNLGKEIPFTVANEGSENDEKLSLYTLHAGVEYKYPLSNENGLLKLAVNNPFEESDDIISERLTGLSTDWIENRSQGFDNTVDFEMSKEPGYGPEDIFVENKPFSLRQILDLIESGDIELSPDFQRNFIWDRTRQSKLIESILLGLPLPSIYLSQYKDGRLTVVDGLQRLSTIKAFFKNQLRLSNLEYLVDCNDKCFSELESVLSPLRVRRFSQTQIMCFVIDYRSPSKLKFDLFRRLNTGGKPLNNQEIRNCLSRPEVQKILKGMIDQDSFRYATNDSVRDARMDAREAALRFIYFYEQYNNNDPIGNYSGDMESTLDYFIDELNFRDSNDLEKYLSIYDNALNNCYHLFGELCFRKVLPETLLGRRSPVNKLLMLSFSVLLSRYDNNRITSSCAFEGMVEPLAHFIKNEENIFPAITYGTNGKWNLTIAFNGFKRFLDQNIK